MPFRSTVAGAFYLLTVTVVMIAGGGCGLQYSDEDATRFTARMAFDEGERRHPRYIELEAVGSGWEAGLVDAGLHALEAWEDDDGRTHVLVFTTGSHAAELQRYGLHPFARPEEVVREIGSIEQAINPQCSLVTNEYFMDFADIEAETASIAASSNYIERYSIGQSVEGEEIWAVQFGPTQSTVEPAPALVLVHTQHAREWLTTALALHYMRHLEDVMSGGGTVDLDLWYALEDAAIIIVPVANPDGYKYTRDPNGDRCWRGNRNLASCSSGIDINRNYSVGRDELIADQLACPPFLTASTTYAGPYSGSEPESKAISELFASYWWASGLPQVFAAAGVDFHTYAEDVLIPNGYHSQDDAQGPRCPIRENQSSCENPDLRLFHRVFGMPNADHFLNTWTGERMPFEQHNMLFVGRNAATLGSHGNSRDDNEDRTLTISYELPGWDDFEFFAECESTTDIAEFGNKMLGFLRHTVPALDELRSLREVEPYSMIPFGRLGAGLR